MEHVTGLSLKCMDRVKNCTPVSRGASPVVATLCFFCFFRGVEFFFFSYLFIFREDVLSMVFFFCLFFVNQSMTLTVTQLTKVLFGP